VNVFEAGIAALAVCFATGLPGDWARRRDSGATAGLMQVVTVAGIVGAIAIDTTAGWLHGFWPAAVIVIAIVLGEVLADQLATREHVRRSGVRQRGPPVRGGLARGRFR
jgi:cation transport ATPase